MYSRAVRVHPSELLEERIKRKHWPLRKVTPGRLDLTAKDEVIFYLGAPEYTFAGQAEVGGVAIESSAELSDFGSESVDNPKEFTLPFLKAKLWAKPVKVRDMAPRLNLFVGKRHWGGYLQCAVVKIGDEDFQKIVAAAEDN